jgi:hypothetical protein
MKAPSGPRIEHYDDRSQRDAVDEGFLLLYAIASSAVLAQDARPVRVISEMPGWFVRDRQAVRGDRLSAKEEITGRTKTDIILDCGVAGSIAYTYKQAPCRVRACVPAAEGVSVQRVDPDARSGAGARHPSDRCSPRFFGARGGGDPNDAVVARNGDKVDFAPAWNRLLEGRYCFNFRNCRQSPRQLPPHLPSIRDRERKEAGRARRGDQARSLHAAEGNTRRTRPVRCRG